MLLELEYVQQVLDLVLPLDLLCRTLGWVLVWGYYHLDLEEELISCLGHQVCVCVCVCV